MPHKCIVGETYLKFSLAGNEGFRITKADISGVTVNYVNLEK